MQMRKIGCSVYDLVYRLTKVQNSMMSLAEQTILLEPLYQQIKRASNVHEKLEILNGLPQVKSFIATSDSIRTFLAGLTPECDLAIKSILAIGQGHIVFNLIDTVEDKFERLRQLLQTLLEVEKFYSNVGGIIGYHYLVLKLITEKKAKSEPSDTTHYSKPPGIDISKESPKVFSATRKGIESLPRMAEIYPVGGAGDRLKLSDENTGEPLPSAQLPYAGRTLLEGLIRDLQAKEYLHFKLHGKQITTPVAMMTSHEKNNHSHIINICETANWFGRPKESFKFFIQPLVPVITEEGNWSLKEPLLLTLKPGGHGVIWKLAMDNGIFEWLHSLKRDKALLRQINNPVAGTDYGNLAFTGYGCSNNKAFGFASCPRLLKASEGMIVLIQKPMQGSFEYCITNIEYTDFQCKGIQDIPENPTSKYSAFPANTNILFVDLDQIQKALEVCPIPGMLVNMKSMTTFIDSDGVVKEVHGGRLESTMQNIADAITDTFPKEIKENEYDKLKTFVTYNERRKTISVTKNEYSPDKSHQETPEGSFLEFLENCYDLLNNYSKVKLPANRMPSEALSKGPSFLFHYHPALGPLYHVIAKKLRRGEISEGSELYLEIAELDIENLKLNGSLHVIAKDIIGLQDSKGLINYSHNSGKCELKDVVVKNRGVDWKAENKYWKHDINRNEAMVVTLHGSGEFFAEGVVFEGNVDIEVPDGMRMEAYMQSGELQYKMQPISASTWHWEYFYRSDDSVDIQKKRLEKK